MKLIGSLTSPFVRKVRVLLAEKGLDVELVQENVMSPESTVPNFNPLRKVPVMVTDEGESLYDSSVITEHVDGLADPPFMPRHGLERSRVRRDEALGDGIADAGVLIFYERKREPALRDDAWMARQRQKIDAGVAEIGRRLSRSPWLGGDSLSLGDISCACALLWIEFRLPEIRWREEQPALAQWAASIEARESFRATRPPPA